MESAEGPPGLRKPRWELAGRSAGLLEGVASALMRTEQARVGLSVASRVCLGSRWRRWPELAVAAVVAELVGRLASASWTGAGEAASEQVAAAVAAMIVGVGVAAAVAVQRWLQQSGSGEIRAQTQTRGQA